MILIEYLFFLTTTIPAAFPISLSVVSLSRCQVSCLYSNESMSNFDTTNVQRHNSKKSWGQYDLRNESFFGVSADVANKKENGQSFTCLVNYRPIRRQEWKNVEILFASVALAFGLTKQRPGYPLVRKTEKRRDEEKKGRAPENICIENWIIKFRCVITT